MKGPLLLTPPYSLFIPRLSFSRPSTSRRATVVPPCTLHAWRNSNVVDRCSRCHRHHRSFGVGGKASAVLMLFGFNFHSSRRTQGAEARQHRSPSIACQRRQLSDIVDVRRISTLCCKLDIDKIDSDELTTLLVASCFWLTCGRRQLPVCTDNQCG